MQYRVKNLSIISFLSVLVLLVFPQEAQAQTASLYFSPATATIKQGETVWITVMVNTGGEAANAVAAYFSYPQNIVEAVSVDKTGSIMTLFAEESAGSGIVQISGGRPTPGFTGVQKIASVGFRAKTSSGLATLAFSPDAAVLSNSTNQNILNRSLLGMSVITVSPAASVSAPSVPQSPVVPKQSTPPVVPTPQTPTLPTPTSTPTPTPSPVPLTPLPPEQTPSVAEIETPLPEAKKSFLGMSQPLLIFVSVLDAIVVILLVLAYVLYRKRQISKMNKQDQYTARP